MFLTEQTTSSMCVVRCLLIRWRTDILCLATRRKSPRISSLRGKWYLGRENRVYTDYAVVFLVKLEVRTEVDCPSMRVKQASHTKLDWPF